MNSETRGLPITVDSTARCQAHQHQAHAICNRCGAFICADCQKWWSERPVCNRCREWYEAAGPSTGSVWSLALVTAGFFLLVPGIIGLTLAHRELAKVDRGECSETSQSYASLARTLGWCQVAVLVIVVVLALRNF